MKQKNLVKKLEGIASRLSSINDLSALALNIEKILEEIIDVEHTGFYLWSPELKTLKLFYAKGFSEEERIEAEITAMERHPGKVFRERKIISVPNVLEDTEHTSITSKRSFIIKSRLYLPVMNLDECVGAFGLASTKIDSFSKEHIALLSFVCNLTGVIYRNLISANEIRESEEAMRHVSTRLSLATRAGGVGIWDWDVVNNILVWDEQMYRLYGISADQFSGAYDAWRDGLHPEDSQYGDQEIQLALSGEKEFNTEFRVVWKDNSIHHIQGLAKVQRDSSGRPIRMIGTNWDITERKRVSDQLKRSEDNHRIINNFSTSLLGADNVEEIVWNITHNCISELSLEAASIYLFEPDSDWLIMRATHGRGQDKDDQTLDPVRISLGQGLIGTVAATAKELIVPDVTTDAQSIRDGQSGGSKLAVPIIYEKEVIGVITSDHSQKNFFREHHLDIFLVIADLAANKIMRAISLEKTKKSELKYRNIFESIQDVYAEIDYDTGLIIEVSPSIERFSGYAREEVLGQPLNAFYAPPGPTQELTEALGKHGRVNDVEAILVDKLGLHRAVSFTCSIVTDSSEYPFKIVGTMRDIQLRKQAEVALQQSANIKTNFVSNVSHELRTPMASILGFAGTILRDKNMDEETKMDFIRVINEEAHRLTCLIENVLDISRMEAGSYKLTMEPTQLEHIIHEVIENQTVLANKKNIDIQYDIEKDLPLVFGARDAISQMAVNVLSNAIKFTNPGGSIMVGLSLHDGHIVFDVKDSGLGIPPADLTRIFEKFYRVERAKREDVGTGIGLAIVKEIVDQHQGTVRVESTVGKGTIFRVSLPVLIPSSE